MQVVGQQDHRPLVREVGDEPVEPVQDREPGVLGGGGGGGEDDGGVRRGARQQLVGDDPVEELVHEPEAEAAVELGGPRAEHERAPFRGLGAGGLEHGGLADARGPSRIRTAPTPLRAASTDPPDRGQLLLARQQAGGH